MFWKSKRSKTDCAEILRDFLGEFIVELETFDKGNKVLRLSSKTYTALALGTDYVTKLGRQANFKQLADRSDTLSNRFIQASKQRNEEQFQFELVQAFRNFLNEAKVTLRREESHVSENRDVKNKRFNILVVDDEEIEFDIVSRSLSAECDLELATTPVRALEMLRTKRPDLIVLDVNLGAVSGNELLRYIKDIPALKRIPVLMRSNHSDDSSVVSGLTGGALDYITKDLTPDAFNKRVMEVLQTGRTRLYS